eukprot:PhF_6_TR11722/c0_g1_i2/m.19120
MLTDMNEPLYQNDSACICVLPVTGLWNVCDCEKRMRTIWQALPTNATGPLHGFITFGTPMNVSDMTTVVGDNSTTMKTADVTVSATNHTITVSLSELFKTRNMGGLELYTYYVDPQLANVVNAMDGTITFDASRALKVYWAKKHSATCPQEGSSEVIDPVRGACFRPPVVGDENCTFERGVSILGPYDRWLFSNKTAQLRLCSKGDGVGMFRWSCGLRGTPLTVYPLWYYNTTAGDVEPFNMTGCVRLVDGTFRTYACEDETPTTLCSYQLSTNDYGVLTITANPQKHLSRSGVSSSSSTSHIASITIAANCLELLSSLVATPDVAMSTQAVQNVMSLRCGSEDLNEKSDGGGGLLLDATRYYSIEILGTDGFLPSTYSSQAKSVVLAFVGVVVVGVVHSIVVAARVKLSSKCYTHIFQQLLYPRLPLQYIAVLYIPVATWTVQSTELFLTIPMCVTMGLCLILVHVYVCVVHKPRCESIEKQSIFEKRGQWKPQLASIYGNTFFGKYWSSTPRSHLPHYHFWTIFVLGILTSPLENHETCGTPRTPFVSSLLWIVTLVSFGLSIWYVILKPTLIEMLSYVFALRSTVFGVIGVLMICSDEDSVSSNITGAAEWLVLLHIALGYVEVLVNVSARITPEIRRILTNRTTKGGGTSHVKNVVKFEEGTEMSFLERSEAEKAKEDLL